MEEYNYKDIFAKAKEYGIPFTIHAGEADGPESVRDAIEFGAKRIGHGTRAYQDPSVVELIKSRGIFLEMCPTSNKQTFAVEDMRSKGISPVYLVTDHTNFYERYGWEFFCMVQGDGEPGMTRMYVHR